jgi:hypothetical protein
MQLSMESKEPALRVIVALLAGLSITFLAMMVGSTFFSYHQLPLVVLLALSGLMGGGTAVAIAPRSKRAILVYYLIPIATFVSGFGAYLAYQNRAEPWIIGFFWSWPSLIGAAAALWLGPEKRILRIAILGMIAIVLFSVHTWSRSPGVKQTAARRGYYNPQQERADRRSMLFDQVDQKLRKLTANSKAISIVPDPGSVTAETVPLTGHPEGSYVELDYSARGYGAVIHFPVENPIKAETKIPLVELQGIGFDSQYLHMYASDLRDGLYYVPNDSPYATIKLNPDEVVVTLTLDPEQGL